MSRRRRRVAEVGPRVFASCTGIAALRVFAACGAENDVRGELRCDELRIEAVPEVASAVIVLNDTMRREVVGAYGGKARTPRLDALAAQALLFERAVSQSPWTKPSIATLFTSLYPSQHRVASDPSLRRSGGGAVAEVAVDALRESEAWQRAAVIVTSDHGEALYRRGYGSHGMGLFEDETALPLVARFPGVEPAQGRIGCVVGLVDLMPSLCEYLGADCPRSSAGWSFLRRPGTPRDTTRRFLVTEGVMGRPSLRALHNRRFKLLYEPEGKRGRGGVSDPPWSLYDLEEDPRERFDRVEARHSTSRSQRAYRAMSEALPQPVADYQAPDEESAPVSPELERRLEALGYLDD